MAALRLAVVFVAAFMFVANGMLTSISVSIVCRPIELFIILIIIFQLLKWNQSGRNISILRGFERYFSDEYSIGAPYGI